MSNDKKVISLEEIRKNREDYDFWKSADFPNKEHYESFEKQITEINLAMQAADLPFSVYASRTADSDNTNLYEAVFCKGKNLDMEETFVISDVSNGIGVIRGLDDLSKQIKDKVLQEDISYCFYSLSNNFRLLGTLDKMEFNQNLEFKVNSYLSDDVNYSKLEFEGTSKVVDIRDKIESNKKKSNVKGSLKPRQDKNKNNSPTNEPLR